MSRSAAAAFAAGACDTGDFPCGCVDAMRRFGLLLPMAVFAVAAVPGHAVEATQRHFSISPQALPGALIAFGRQAGVQVLTAGGAVARLRTSGVQGDYAPTMALAQLLQGTGLVASFVDADTVVVKPAPTPARAAVRIHNNHCGSGADEQRFRSCAFLAGSEHSTGRDL